MHKYSYDHKQSHNERVSRCQRKRRKLLQQIKLERGCDVCGYNKCASALQFHHHDLNIKEFQISDVGHDYNRVLAEIAKCRVLCANCHFELHENNKQIEKSQLSKDFKVKVEYQISFGGE